MFGFFKRDHDAEVLRTAWQALTRSNLVLKLGSDRRVIWASDTFLDLFGYTLEEIEGLHHAELCPPAEAASAEYRALWTTLLDGRFDRGVYKRRSRSGEDLWLYATYNPVFTLTGKVDFILKIATDVTESRRERAELDGRLAAIDRTQAMVELDLDGRVSSANRNFLDLVVASQDQVCGHHLRKFCCAPEAASPVFWERMAQGRFQTGTYEFRSRLGRDLLLHATFNPILDPGGRPAKVVFLATDVTDRNELTTALERAEDAARAKSAFLANMSHEVRTPMAGVMGFAELLLDSKLNADQRHQAQMIHESGQNMMRLLNDILDVSKIEAGEMRLVSEPVDIRHKIASCVELMRPVAEQKGITIGYTVAPAVPRRIVGDGLRLRQILLNLVGNAVKFTDKGMVSIVAGPLRDDEGTLSIEVLDTGRGIPAGQIARVLDKFAQAHAPTVRQPGGTGLGLTISSDLATLMGGALEIESEEGVGTRVTVRVPLREAREPQKSAEPATVPPVAVAAAGARVLVAEDYDINQHLIRSQLSNLGVRCDIAGNGMEAVRMARAAADSDDPYRLVFMDLRMPEVDGLEAARILREEGLSPASLPIVALTANAYDEDVKACRAAGMQAHLAKPTSIAALASALERWVSGGAAQEIVEPREAASALALSPALRARFEQRRDDVLERLHALAGRDDCDEQAVRELAGMLHKLAGTAGMFGMDALGEAARHYERALLKSGPERLASVLDDADRALRQAA